MPFVVKTNYFFIRDFIITSYINPGFCLLITLRYYFSAIIISNGMYGQGCSFSDSSIDKFKENQFVTTIYRR